MKGVEALMVVVAGIMSPVLCFWPDHFTKSEFLTLLGFVGQASLYLYQMGILCSNPK
jgi:hypothetical protein